MGEKDLRSQLWVIDAMLSMSMPAADHLGNSQGPTYGEIAGTPPVAKDMLIQAAIAIGEDLLETSDESSRWIVWKTLQEGAGADWMLAATGFD